MKKISDNLFEKFKNDEITNLSAIKGMGCTGGGFQLLKRESSGRTWWFTWESDTSDGVHGASYHFTTICYNDPQQ